MQNSGYIWSKWYVYYKNYIGNKWKSTVCWKLYILLLVVERNKNKLKIILSKNVWKLSNKTSIRAVEMHTFSVGCCFPHYITVHTHWLMLATCTELPMIRMLRGRIIAPFYKNWWAVPNILLYVLRRFIYFVLVGNVLLSLLIFLAITPTLNNLDF